MFIVRGCYWGYIWRFLRTFCMLVHSYCSANSSLVWHAPGHHTFCLLLISHTRVFHWITFEATVDLRWKMSHERKGKPTLLFDWSRSRYFIVTSHNRPQMIKWLHEDLSVSQSSFSKVRNHWVWFNNCYDILKMLFLFLDRMSKHVRCFKLPVSFLKIRIVLFWKMFRFQRLDGTKECLCSLL